MKIGGAFLVNETNMKITYYLGAGASYNAIPIVGQLDRAFKNLSEQLSPFYTEFEKLNLTKQLHFFQHKMFVTAFFNCFEF